MLAKLPPLLYSRRIAGTENIFAARYKNRPICSTTVERTNPGFLWSVAGFFIDDMFERRGDHAAIYADRHLVVTRTNNPAGLRFAGEIDVSNSPAVSETVRIACGANGNAHIDLTNLSFCDISGIRALVEAAHEMREGGRLLLHGLPEQLQTVMRVTGWSDLPSLALCTCRREA